jgi:hypothetical protein
VVRAALAGGAEAELHGFDPPVRPGRQMKEEGAGRPLRRGPP